METEKQIAIAPDSAIPASLADRVREYRRGKDAENTRRAYASDASIFAEWARARGFIPLPASPSVIAAFLTDEADRGISAATVKRRRAAIRFVHVESGFADPTADTEVRETLRGIRRARGTAPHPKLALTAEKTSSILRKIGAPAPTNVAALRDRAMIMLGFATGSRRSELTALRFEDVEFVAAGIVVHIRRSKTDQEGAGRTLSVSRGEAAAPCPVGALAAWIAAAGIASGPLFRRIRKGGQITSEPLTPYSYTLILKRRAGTAGFDPDKIGGHSTRSGMVTSAFALGRPAEWIMDKTGHRNMSTLLMYRHDTDLFAHDASKGLLTL